MVLPSLALLCLLAASAAIAGTVGSVLFVTSLGVFIFPGLWLARFQFAGCERLLVGTGLGYLVTSLVASGLYRIQILAVPSIVAGVLILSLVFARVGRRATAERPDCGRRGWLLASMLVPPLLVVIPFLKVGAETLEGVAYRAYFSADLMTHLSVVGELQKGAFPPENPFYAGEPLGYYWLFFLFPSLVGKWMGNQEALLLTYLSGGLLFAGLGYAVARRLGLGSGRAFLAVFFLLVAASFEGLALVARSIGRGDPLGIFRTMNVDAFSRWVLELTSIDGLHRSLLYTPQHLFSYSLLLILVLLVLRGEPRGVVSSAIAGGLLGGMAGTSIVTAMLAGPWLVIVRVSRGGDLKAMARDLAVIGTVSATCLAWFFDLGFFGDAGAALTLRRPQLLEIPALIIFECGPLVLLSVASWKSRTVRPFAILGLMSFLAVLCLDIRGYEGVWMAWRAGSVLLICLFLMAAVGLQKWRPAALGLLILFGSLTALLDIYNAQDVTNQELSAGDFRWTTMVRRDEVAALEWIRAETPTAAVVQWDTRAREPGEWGLIPALAERRMAVGLPIFLLDQRKYRVRERRKVRPIFTSFDPVEAHRLAVESGIDYLFVGRRELDVRGERLRRLWDVPDRFKVSFAKGDATVFAVVR